MVAPVTARSSDSASEFCDEGDVPKGGGTADVDGKQSTAIIDCEGATHATRVALIRSLEQQLCVSLPPLPYLSAPPCHQSLKGIESSPPSTPRLWVP